MMPHLWPLPRFFLLFAAVLVLAFPQDLRAFERVSLQITGSDAAMLQPGLEAAAQLNRAQADGVSAPQDVLSLALQDYANLLDALYAQARYSAAVSIKIDGAEAALIETGASEGPAAPRSRRPRRAVSCACWRKANRWCKRARH